MYIHSHPWYNRRVTRPSTTLLHPLRYGGYHTPRCDTVCFSERTAPIHFAIPAHTPAKWKCRWLPDKILIANRGEIACRVMRSCQALGIKTVAVYSDVDASSVHVQMADEAVLVGPANSADSYLNIDNVMAAIKKTGAQAVHPGYGFLSENFHFAQRLKEAGVTFIAPNVEAIEAMGDKIESKVIAKNAGVNTIPGYDGEIEDVETAVKVANDIGYPVMVKASAGGGGKGMRVAWNDEECRESFTLSKSEALSSFGDDRMLVEKYIDNPRHIEIQVLGDAHGNYIYLAERECSIQRRNQKVIEEAPSLFIDESGDINTKFIEQVYPDGFKTTELSAHEIKSLMAVAAMMNDRIYQRSYEYLGTNESANPNAPAHTHTAKHPKKYMVLLGEEELPAEVTYGTGSDCTVRVGEETITLSGEWRVHAPLMEAKINGKPITVQHLGSDSYMMQLGFKGSIYPVRILTETQRALYTHMPEPVELDTSLMVVSPMPGQIVAMNVKVGDTVGEGTVVAVVEAMKMQNSLRAGCSGKIISINAQPGENVSADDIIIEFEKAPDAAI
ncbi:hypothetical protein SARC_06805 [Sphaeroforma arctica JP610]|uniref:propionyl-CoA carboxylase n=1 Tax=Sphaeroforma arctica JP610 TaxID=667725 RepID=A0A0L0FW19_9EUKA|nr:hypothetical protein SARC_06805 [Sphaeroforma arctica JP610]KNC80844.1 hypothetical protein SARC_06805 [Sphaeroforma arctica JP610]|eukprot:XP_014154746.1 hypothetical protein SARC_06805 [Sphaeroforma arctica JP610]